MPQTHAVSLAIAPDLTLQQMKTIMTNRMNILIAVKEVNPDPTNPLGMHIQVEAEVEDVPMLRDVLNLLLEVMTDGHLLTDQPVSKSEVDAVVAEELARRGLRKKVTT